ncbi:MAG: hypothetical protein ACE10K_12620 [Rhodothermales bacterium]
MNNTTYKTRHPILAALAALRRRRPAAIQTERSAKRERENTASVDATDISYPIQVAKHGIGVKGLL